jgi:CBS domain-containing protein
MNIMKVRELMRYPVSTVKPDSTVKDVIVDLLVERKDTILVARDGLLKKCEGIVTKSKIYMKVLAANLDPNRVKISEVVEPRHLITISPNASCKEAAELMINNNIRKLPVVENEVLVGMITSEDLLQCVG